MDKIEIRPPNIISEQVMNWLRRDNISLGRVRVACSRLDVHGLANHLTQLCVEDGLYTDEKDNMFTGVDFVWMAVHFMEMCNE